MNLTFLTREDNTERIWTTRGLCLLAAFFYPAWWFIVKISMPSFNDPLVGRCLIGSLFILVWLSTYLSNFCKKYSHLLYYICIWTLTAHYFNLVFINNLSAVHAIGTFVVVFSASACFFSHVGLSFYALYVMILGSYISFSIDNELRYTYVSGLATAFIISFYAIAGRLSLLKLERSSNEKLQTLIYSLQSSQESLQTTQNQLTHAQKMEVVGQLASGIAHDFNNILAAILIQTENIQESNPDNQQLSDDLNIIEKSAERAADLTKKILGFAKKGQYELKFFNLNDTLREVITLINRTFPLDIKVQSNLFPNLPPIKGDSSQLFQVLLNLAVNSRDAMGEGGTLTFQTEYCHALTPQEIKELELPQGSYVKTQISDTGIGMSKQILNKIFEPFFTTKAVGQGTGLGLAMSFGIIKSHQGEIKVKSELTKGTDFTIYLPACLEAPLETHHEPYRIQNSDPTKGRFSGLCLLVTDDDPILLKVLTKALEREGAKILACHDGQHALEVFKEQGKDVHLLIMDVKMPNMNGIEAFKNIRKTRPNIPVIFISGYAESDEIISTLKNKNVSFLVKPFKPADIMSQIEKYTHSKTSLQ